MHAPCRPQCCRRARPAPRRCCQLAATAEPSSSSSEQPALCSSPPRRRTSIEVQQSRLGAGLDTRGHAGGHPQRSFPSNKVTTAISLQRLDITLVCPPSQQRTPHRAHQRPLLGIESRSPRNGPRHSIPSPVIRSSGTGSGVRLRSKDFEVPPLRGQKTGVTVTTIAQHLGVAVLQTAVDPDLVISATSGPTDLRPLLVDARQPPPTALHRVSTAAAEPDRSRCTSSIQQPPTSIDATKDSTLRPAPEPADPPGRTVSSINASKPSLDITVPATTTPHQPPKTHHRTPPRSRRSHLIRSSQEVPPLVARMRYFKQPPTWSLSSGRANPLRLTASVDSGSEAERTRRSHGHSARR